MSSPNMELVSIQEASGRAAPIAVTASPTAEGEAQIQQPPEYDPSTHRWPPWRALGSIWESLGRFARLGSRAQRSVAYTYVDSQVPQPQLSTEHATASEDDPRSIRHASFGRSVSASQQTYTTTTITSEYPTNNNTAGNLPGAGDQLSHETPSSTASTWRDSVTAWFARIVDYYHIFRTVVLQLSWQDIRHNLRRHALGEITEEVDDDPSCQQLLLFIGIITLWPVVFVLGGLMLLLTPKENVITRRWGCVNVILAILLLLGVLRATVPPTPTVILFRPQAKSL